jgi:probable HAF family extracellular repeat protein
VLNDPLAIRGTTYAAAINDAGTIVGSYEGHDLNYHGFIYQDGTFTTVDAPGATATYLRGINNNGEIIGGYSTPSGNAYLFPDEHGLIYQNGTITTLDNPGNSNTTLVGINDAGTIVGFDSYDLSGPLGFIISPDPIAMAPLAYTPDMASLTVWEAVNDASLFLDISNPQLQDLIAFSNAQYAYGQHIGLPDPGLYVYEALGAALSAQPNFLDFANINDDTAFVTAIAGKTFYPQQESPAQIQSFLGQLHFLEAFYSAAHIANYELVAKGATFGQMLGVEAELTVVPIVGTSMHV